MRKTVTIVREYDDNGKLTSETKTTKVTKEAQDDRWHHFGFGLPPLTVNAEEGP